MRKGLAFFLTGLMVLSILIIPIPSGALDYGMDKDLGSVDASFWGDNSDDGLGSSFVIAGDVNGDGFDDMVISAAGNDEGGSSSGQTYILFGKTSGWSMDMDLSNADASFIGESAGDSAGRVASAGDVNGDGYDDIIIGSSNRDEGGTDKGQTYLILGNATGWAMGTSLSNADASFIGEANGDAAGRIGGAGDVNGDGYDDFLIGAYHNDGGGTDSGQTYLILGKATGWAMDTSLSNADASFIGESSSDWSGASVMGAGDVNGDGYDDFLIGSTYNDDGASNGGQAYVIFGMASGWAMDRDLSTANASFVGEGASEAAGIAVGGAGDVNGDGYDDILIGATWNNDGGNHAGKAYLNLGKSVGWTKDKDLGNSDATFIGENTDDHAGCWVADLGDINGDGFDDFIVGAKNNDEGGTWAGQVYVILGKASGWTRDVDFSNVDLSFLGEGALDGTGYSVSGAGDVDGDGYDDILIGVSGNDENSSGAGQTYLIFPDHNSKPTPISSVKAYSESSCSVEISTANLDDMIFVELQGTDGNSTRKDTAVVNVTSSESSPKGFRLRLLETGINTGRYRGNFTIKDRTHDEYLWIGASNGETITVASIQDPTKNATILIGAVILFPLVDNLTAQEDLLYNEHYWTVGGPGANWVFDSNATWLEWNGTSHNISGIPDNSDVGSYYVTINASMGVDNCDEHNFTLIVNNTPPEINTSDVGAAIEDLEYEVDYNCTDDGQGMITWHLETDADDWLSINSSIGNISGNPMNEHVGQYYLNVSVDDGNDGWDYSNFTLTVTNTNDAPIITTENNETAFEDSLYTVQYEAQEIDVGDNLVWSMVTNASQWLEIGGGTGLLSWTPENDDVGSYWVNITVKDSYPASDFTNFTLTVNNTNDLPEITSIPITIATANYQYVYQVTATDVDIGDVLTFSLDERPDGMTINGTSGLARWLPTEAQKGQNPVTVKVSDGHGSVTQSFIIDVEVPVSYDPLVTLLTPRNGSDLDITNPELTWSVEDPDSDTVYFDLYLSDNKGKVDYKDPSVKVAEEIVTTVYIPPSELVKGTTYYWTVSPFDGNNIGKCLNGTWSFKIKEEATINQKPTAVLNAPTNEATLNSLTVQLEWSGADPDSETIYYDLYLHSDQARVKTLDPAAKAMEASTETTYIASSLAAATTYYWTVIPNDGDNVGNCTSGIWSFIISSTATENHAPVITTQPVEKVFVGEEYRYDVDATDQDGDVLSFSLVQRPSNMVIDKETGLIIWTPTQVQIGNHTVKVKVSDQELFFVQTFKIEVKETPVENNRPAITPILDRTVKVGDSFEYQVAASDADPGDTLTYSIDGAPDGIAISSSGMIEWVPGRGQVGEHIITVNVSDGKEYAITHFKITVEKKVTTPSSGELDAMMIGLILVIVIVAVLIVVLAMMKWKGKGPDDLEEEEAHEEYEEPQEDPPEEKMEEECIEQEPVEDTKAELEDEIDLDDLEDED